MKQVALLQAVVVAGGLLFNSPTSFSQEDLPYFLKDRGTGVFTSMFATYIHKGEYIVYPFYELYYDQNLEYKPSELGHGSDQDFRGRFRAHEGLIFLGYGVTDRLALELEAAVITATLSKANSDTSSMPAELKESGLGDVASQLRWRWAQETINRPEIFSYFEIGYPLQRDRKLIGTQEWEFKLGHGIIKGFRWGTITLRAAVEYVPSKFDLGEYAVEYLKQISPLFRFYLGVEGTQDEVEFITDLQFHVHKNAFIRINNAFGVTSKATDYAPELGVLFHF